MMGSETSNDPACLWYNWNHNADAVTRRVVEVIREIKPQAIITFNKYGGYGHPDHIAIQRATSEAFKLAGDADYLTDGQQPYTPQKLYYSSFPRWLLTLRLNILKLQGHDVRHMGRNKDIDYQMVMDNVEPVHTLVDIADYLTDWDEASACHVSQGGGSMRGFFGRIPMWLRRIIAGKQGLTRVYPQPGYGRIDERDLFENVSEEEPQPEPV
jgi:LmbE family N-acetylglucosaminyl deacetylase